VNLLIGPKMGNGDPQHGAALPMTARPTGRESGRNARSIAAGETVMTEPHSIEPAREAGTHADRDPEVKPEIISDLDVPGDDARHILGGSMVQCPSQDCPTA
jgi:hypothetical protein